MTSDYVIKFLLKLKTTLIAKLPKPQPTKKKESMPIEEEKNSPEEKEELEAPLIEFVVD